MYSFFNTDILELMIHHRSIVKDIFFSLFFLTFLSLGFTASAQDGKTLFQNNCASCHHPVKDGTGPALKGAAERVGSADLLHKWVHNPPGVIASGNAYFSGLFKQRGVMMTPFPSLTEKDIDAILKYVEDYKAPVSTPGPGSPDGVAQEGDNSLLYGILTLILAVITLILLQVNSNLKKLSDDREGVPASEPVPFYRNKAYIATLAVVLFVVGGYYTIQGAIGLGRNKDYQPEQPVFYSHKVHAGTNQISCLYCHGGAYEGKHANIPAVNMCMNCHMAISEYTGTDKLYREDGTEVNGTAEIQKIYAASGWDPKAKKYTGKTAPIEWIKIHNLPDHVFFSHAQHTRAGKVQCQTCHGPIQEMNEVKQFADLSMGWCINCHRESKVQFFNQETGEGNKFYSVYEKFHNDLKSHKVDSVTVEMIGGTECQKCHY